MHVLIQAILIGSLSVGSALFLNAEYKKIRRLRDYRDLRPYIVPSIIGFGGFFTLLILLYLGSAILQPSTLIGLLGGYLALAVAIPIFGTFTAIISRSRGVALQEQTDKPGTKYLEFSLNIVLAGITIMILWRTIRAEAFLSMPWYFSPFETSFDRVCTGLLGAYGVLGIVLMSKYVFIRYLEQKDDHSVGISKEME